MTDKFDQWYESTHSVADDENYSGAMDAWDYRQEQVESLIERIENYPCCMSCYATIEEMKSAQRMKETILRILKGEVWWIN